MQPEAGAADSSKSSHCDASNLKTLHLVNGVMATEQDRGVSIVEDAGVYNSSCGYCHSGCDSSCAHGVGRNYVVFEVCSEFIHHLMI
jgi:hypothetical protein